MTGPRFALYFAPEDETALARFGWSWLGRRPDTDADAPFPAAVAGDARHAPIVAAPRLYGLHATLKPPFHLRDGATRAELVAAMETFCRARRPFETDPLALGAIGEFLALRPRAATGAADAIRALADACVETFDRFRAPAGAEEKRRRIAQGLSPRQQAHLDRWGYPHVFDDFRFHVTLTDRLDQAERERVCACLGPLLAEVHAERVAFHSLCLFEQPRPGARFVLSLRLPFAGA